MSFTEAVKTCFQKYIDFSGRAGRPEYWWFFLFAAIAAIATGWIPIIETIVTLLLLLPSLAVGARRLHDIDRTGWWLLLALVPLIGWIALLVMLVQPGTRDANRYGDDPSLSQPSGRRRYCTQCGAVRAADAAMFCTACGIQF